MYQVIPISHEIARSKLNSIGKTVFWLAAVAAIPGSFYGPHWLAAYCRITKCKALPTDILACHQLAFATTAEISQLSAPLGHKCRHGQLRYLIKKDNIPAIENTTCHTTLPKNWQQWRDDSLDCSMHPEHCQIPPQQRIVVCADESELEWMNVVSTSINLQQHCRHVESEFNVGEIVCGIILGLLYLCCLFNLIIAVQASDRSRDCYLNLSAAITSLICLPAVLFVCLEQRQARQAYPPLRANAGPSLCSKIATVCAASKAGLIKCVTSTGRGLYHFFHCCRELPLAGEARRLPEAIVERANGLPMAPSLP